MNTKTEKNLAKKGYECIPSKLINNKIFAMFNGKKYKIINFKIDAWNNTIVLAPMHTKIIKNSDYAKYIAINNGFINTAFNKLDVVFNKKHQKLQFEDLIIL